ncbi:MAG: hypothetical protein Terrestrivirus2_167 [Terrestrivirus sp.]|uniref:Uncharacterized protein n=1 Tax=Terrestrivirus sp. TaxID=2487775 RepID=A0A3G4ZQE1_9VIRU|nr:MAG: hypothetical protein Terrestrivirus2_167 [Terrestrivirus sp.]
MNNVSTPLPDISATSADEEIKQFLPNTNVAKTSTNVPKSTIDLSNVLNFSKNSGNIGLNVPRAQSMNVGNVGNVGNLPRAQSTNTGLIQPPNQTLAQTYNQSFPGMEDSDEQMVTGISPMGNISSMGNISLPKGNGPSQSKYDDLEVLGEPSPAPSHVQSQMGMMPLSQSNDKEYIMSEILRFKEKQAELLNKRLEIDSELLELEKQMAQLHEKKVNLMEQKLESHENGDEHVMAGGDPYYKKYLKYKSKYINKQKSLKLRN